MSCAQRTSRSAHHRSPSTTPTSEWGRDHTKQQVGVDESMAHPAINGFRYPACPRPGYWLVVSIVERDIALAPNCGEQDMIDIHCLLCSQPSQPFSFFFDFIPSVCRFRSRSTRNRSPSQVYVEYGHWSAPEGPDAKTPRRRSHPSRIVVILARWCPFNETMCAYQQNSLSTSTYHSRSTNTYRRLSHCDSRTYIHSFISSKSDSDRYSTTYSHGLDW